MTPEQYELRAESCEDMARWHKTQAEKELAKAGRLRKQAAEDREHPPSYEDMALRALRGS